MARRSEKSWQELTHLVAAFNAYLTHIDLHQDEFFKSSGPSLEEGLRVHREAVNAGIDGPSWPKGLLAGLRQGARELFPSLGREFRHHPEVIKEIYKAGGEPLKELLNYRAHVTKIMKRGKIRTEDEYYAVRTLIDDLEGEEQTEFDLKEMYLLVDRFDANELGN